jgi:ribonuclease E
MTKRMLIDTTHAEETRVVVLDGNRLEDFDVETQSRKQLKGNIYLAKVVRVEPSLQAAFVEYGGNRHGFLAFGEIHPDYYQIPVADRQRLLQMQEEEARAEEEDDYDQPASNGQSGFGGQDVHGGENNGQYGAGTDDQPEEPSAQPLLTDHGAIMRDSEFRHEGDGVEGPIPAEFGADIAPEAAEPAPSDASESGDEESLGSRVQEVPATDVAPPETIGGETDHNEEVRDRRPPPRFLRNYKIQEVIRRRQILLIQVVKEERGTKGAALTTYISLAGRFCVLMPNSPRGGGISRKITSATDRRRLKEVTAELEIPRGMGLIVRTAGANRPKPEIKRDCEYLLRLWDDIRELTLKSVAPALIYEEASLIKRAIRDVYSRDVDEILVDGEDGWKAARDFMRMLMPTHVKKVQLWRDNGAPLFARQQVEAQLDAMLSPTVQLKSGGYLVINQTEALVAIDVNSGRSTRERGIEETAVRTNLEAAEETARQLRLRDLAGLIVIDFIDMESKKNNASVERRLKDALKNDRARIQVGHISHFGLMEMSRQRLRPSLAETSLTVCHHCMGTGHVRSTESAALHVLRAIEEEGGKRRAAEILVHVPATIALYILNNKRQRLTDIEARYFMKVGFAADETLLPSQPRVERVRAQTADLPPPFTVHQHPAMPEAADDAEAEADADSGSEAESAEERAAADADDVPVPGETAEEGERRRRRRRRRRRGSSRREDGSTPGQESAPMPLGAEQPDVDVIAFPGGMPVILPAQAAPAPEPVAEAVTTEPPATVVETASTPESEAGEETAPPRARRSRSRRKPSAQTEMAATSAPAEPAPPQAAAVPPAPSQPRVIPPAPPNQAPPAYTGPTPANPFGSGALDIFDLLDQVESAQPPRRAAPQPRSERTAAAANGTAHAAPAPAPEPAKPDPVVGPAIQPVIIGGSEPSAEKKRGWWRK